MKTAGEHGTRTSHAARLQRMRLAFADYGMHAEALLHLGPKFHTFAPHRELEPSRPLVSVSVPVLGSTYTHRPPIAYQVAVNISSVILTGTASLNAPAISICLLLGLVQASGVPFTACIGLFYAIQNLSLIHI